MIGFPSVIKYPTPKAKAAGISHPRPKLDKGMLLEIVDITWESGAITFKASGILNIEVKITTNFMISWCLSFSESILRIINTMVRTRSKN